MHTPTPDLYLYCTRVYETSFLTHDTHHIQKLMVASLRITN